MRCFKVTLEYDGTEYAGFQWQLESRSIQGEVERALQSLTGAAARVHGAGRTDSGVHALGQVISFKAETGIPLDQMAAALNSALPRDIAAVRAEEVGEEFHARFSAAARAYVYVVLNRDAPSALYGRYSYHVPGVLDVPAMDEAARMLIGAHDYVAWANSTKEVRTTTRTVSHCTVRKAGRFVLVRVRANAFLRGMVRNMAGTLLQIGQGKRPVSDIAAITASMSRTAAGPCAPARGLCLVRVWYNREAADERCNLGI